MAKNWSAAEAAQVVFEGKDKASIQDIGKRFPLFVSSAARGAEGLLEIISVLHPERITARTIESKLKEGLEEIEDDETEEAPVKKAPVKGKQEAPAKGKSKKAPVVEDDEDDEEEEEEAPKKKAPAKGKGKTPASKKPVVEEEDDDEDWDDDEEEEEVDYDSMSLSELRKAAKAQKINGKGLDKNGLIAALKGEEPDDEEDDDDWDI